MKSTGNLRIRRENLKTGNKNVLLDYQDRLNGEKCPSGEVEPFEDDIGRSGI